MFEYGQEIEFHTAGEWRRGVYLAACTIYKGEHFIQTPSTGTVFRVTKNEIRKKKVKKEGWVNIYRDPLGLVALSPFYGTEERAKYAAKGGAIDTVRIEWEE